MTQAHMIELEELTSGKTVAQLRRELDFQIANGEEMGGAICSHIVEKISAIMSGQTTHEECYKIWAMRDFCAMPSKTIFPPNQSEQIEQELNIYGGARIEGIGVCQLCMGYDEQRREPIGAAIIESSCGETWFALADSIQGVHLYEAAAIAIEMAQASRKAAQ